MQGQTNGNLDFTLGHVTFDLTRLRMHLKRVRRCLVVWRHLRVSCSVDALKMHGCKTHFTWKFPLKTRFEWMLRSCLATFYYKALWRSHMAAGACQCWRMVASWRSAAPLGASNNARARRLQGFRDGSKLLSLQRSARLSARLQATASAVTCKALETAPSRFLCSGLCSRARRR